MVLEGIIRTEDDATITGRALTVDDCQLKFRYQRGNKIEQDVNCDSAYILLAINRVGKSIRNTYHWMTRSEKRYLVIDNTGGHGTETEIGEYVKALRDNWNVETIFQIPRSPYTNVLDLGVWCSLQARVEDEHFGK